MAFITEKLELTSKEAQQFWPIYNEFESKREELRKQMAQIKDGMDFGNLTEVDAKKAVQELISHEEEKTKNETDFLKNLMGTIPSKKIIMLKVAEEKFKKRMLEELRKRRRN
ncbi:MAG: sensor of ECF-type sigma factor [Bacteroidota bacterium]